MHERQPGQLRWLEQTPGLGKLHARVYFLSDSHGRIVVSSFRNYCCDSSTGIKRDRPNGRGKGTRGGSTIDRRCCARYTLVANNALSRGWTIRGSSRIKRPGILDSHRTGYSSFSRRDHVRDVPSSLSLASSSSSSWSTCRRCRY